MTRGGRGGHRDGETAQGEGFRWGVLILMDLSSLLHLGILESLIQLIRFRTSLNLLRGFSYNLHRLFIVSMSLDISDSRHLPRVSKLPQARETNVCSSNKIKTSYNKYSSITSCSMNSSSACSLEAIANFRVALGSS